ncbi:hypothetical protein FOA52_000231 [Chlamydomonas sp. UWO 241]|nr:hypothetical protein FOA52_000231 [Chlamydomonas sp. UWO 241]
MAARTAHHARALTYSHHWHWHPALLALALAALCSHTVTACPALSELIKNSTGVPAEILLDEARNVIWAATDFGLARLDLSDNRTGGSGAYFKGVIEDVVFSTFYQYQQKNDQSCNQASGRRASSTLFLARSSHAVTQLWVLNITALDDPVLPMAITTINTSTRLPVEDYPDRAANGVAVDYVGNVYVSANEFVDKWNSTDGVTYEDQGIMAGNADYNGSSVPANATFDGIPGPATSAWLHRPWSLTSLGSLAISPVDLLFISDPGNNAIFMVDLGGNTISVAAGTPPTEGGYVSGVGGVTSAVGIRGGFDVCLPPNGNWIGFSERASFSVAAPLANATSALPLPKYGPA